MVVEATNLLIQIEQEQNTFTTRLFEWCSWSFPELYHLQPQKFIEINAEIGGNNKFIGDIRCLTIAE
jgi:RNA processing factor Prp31